MVSHHCGQRFDELPQDCFVVWCLLVSAICILCGTTLPHDRLGSLTTPILQEILKIQNLLRVEHCAFWKSHTRSDKLDVFVEKLQFRTVQQNQKSFLWMQD